MVERRFNAAYTQRIEMSEKLGNIKPLTALVLELAERIIEGEKSALIYINKVQRDLYEKGVLPFEVQSIDDRIKVDELPSGDVHDFLRYVCLAYRYIEEDWYWDEKLQQNIARNTFWQNPE